VAYSEEGYVTSGGSELLCGVKSTYVALNLLRSDCVRYTDVYNSFEFASEKGVSLEQIRNFVTSKNFHTALGWKSEHDISSLTGDKIALVFNEQEPIPHILVKRAVETGIQIIDAPTVTDKRQSNLDTKKRPTLLISTEPLSENLPHKFILAGLVLLFFASLFALFKILKQHKQTK
jgi:hypothetical protein